MDDSSLREFIHSFGVTFLAIPILHRNPRGSLPAAGADSITINGARGGSEVALRTADTEWQR
ncbi:MAG: hypothetical protein HY907_12365 [Deltaproteobacteria bacterium]|nr:hypothetical protein [Deltaproteobacteria bacterium]